MPPTLPSEAELARRAKISAALKGRVKPLEQRAKIAASVRASKTHGKAPSVAPAPPPAPLPALPREEALGAHREAVAARVLAVEEHELLDARCALLAETLSRLEHECEVARERALQARAVEYAAALRCAS